MTRKMPRFLVTGGCGFIGSHMAKRARHWNKAFVNRFRRPLPHEETDDP